MKGLIKRARFVRCVTAFLIAAFVFSILPCREVHADSPAGPAAKYLVLIVIDSCRPDYLSLVPTPNIDELKAEGTFYTNSWVGQLNNDTPPGHTTISTGRFGKNDGVISFGWRETRFLPSDWEFQAAVANALLGFVKVTGWIDLGLWFQNSVMRKALMQNMPTSWENVISGAFTSVIVDSGATSIGALYKKAHPGSHVVAISCDKWFAAAGLAADSADYTVFSDAKGIPPITYNPITSIKPAGMNASPAPDYIMNDPSFVRDVKDEGDTDTWAADVALAIIEKTHPEILLINLPATDDAGHASGGINAPEKMGPVIANADKQIGRIIDAYKQSGKYDQTVFVIVSDHGMTPVTRTVSQAALDRLYVEAGNFSASFSGSIGLLNPEKAKDVAEKITDAHIPGIHGAYYKAKLGDGSYSYEPTSATAASITGDTDKAYRYLLSTWASEKSVDIELITAENWHIDFKTGRGKTFLGNHDSPTWLQQHNILMIAGPGVKKGAISESPARLVDVAPTVLTLMGIRPEKMDGIVLADTLQSPTDIQVQTQNNLNGELMPLVEALKALSKSDLADLQSEHP
jgi:hypothetical protein